MLSDTGKKRMNNNEFDHFISEISNRLLESFFDALSAHEEFKQDVSSSSLLNMTVSCFITVFLRTLDCIEQYTEGDDKLIHNIELIKRNLIKAIADLPFVSKIEEISS